MKNKKNYTIYWLTCIGAILTVPIALLLMKTMSKQTSMVKTMVIMAVFIVLTAVIIILYKNIFGVSLDEITSDNKATNMDKMEKQLIKCRGRFNGNSVYTTAILEYIKSVLYQLQKFKTRKVVLKELLDSKYGESGSGAESIDNLVEIVEKALEVNTNQLLNRIIIFDDMGARDIVEKNLNYISVLVNKNRDILADLENLIIEVSRIGEATREVDTSKLKDVVNAMENLRTDKDDDISNLTKKYE